MPTNKRSVDDLFKDYLHFCDSPLRSWQEVYEDYRLLINHPQVIRLMFHKSDILVVETDCIDITHYDYTYRIGKFLIFIIRTKENKYWFTDFRFVNLTNPLVVEDDDQYYEKYHHPHIINRDNLLGFDTGSLCIMQGGFEIDNAIRIGRVGQAVTMLIEILGMYQEENRPYHEITFWNKVEGKHG